LFVDLGLVVLPIHHGTMSPFFNGSSDIAGIFRPSHALGMSFPIIWPVHDEDAGWW
jgi:hypothetical protein